MLESIVPSGGSSLLQATLLLSSLASFAVLWCAYRSWKALSHIPGPPTASFTILWLLKHAVRGRLNDILVDTDDQYGPLVRIGPDLLLCSDPDEIRRISAVRSEYTKGPAYDAGRVTPGEPHLVSLRDPEKHKALRAKMGLAYSMDVEAGIDRQVANLVCLLTRYASRRGQLRPLDFAQKAQFFALDAIGDIAFGEPFGFLVKDEDLYRFTEMNDSSMLMVTVAGLVPWLAGFRDIWPLKYLVPQEGDQVGFGMLFGFAKSLIDRRTSPEAEEGKDMLQAFINSGMNKHQLMQQVYVHIIAGADSTANVTRMTMLCLLTNPRVYGKLQAEIDLAARDGRISRPATNAEAKALPYLQAVIREGLRMYPPFMAPSKLTPAGGDVVCGFPVPAGIQVGANFFSVLRAKSIWGDDARCFRPERWLEVEDEAKLREMNAAVDVVFGSGKFQCLGRSIALMELNKLFLELLRKFDFSIINQVTPAKVEFLAITIAHGFYVQVTDREPVEGEESGGKQ